MVAPAESDVFDRMGLYPEEPSDVQVLRDCREIVKVAIDACIKDLRLEKEKSLHRVGVLKTIFDGLTLVRTRLAAEKFVESEDSDIDTGNLMLAYNLLLNERKKETGTSLKINDSIFDQIVANHLKCRVRAMQLIPALTRKLKSGPTGSESVSSANMPPESQLRKPPVARPATPRV